MSSETDVHVSPSEEASHLLLDDASRNGQRDLSKELFDLIDSSLGPIGVKHLSASDDSSSESDHDDMCRCCMKNGANSHIQHDEGEEEPRWGSPTVALMQQIKADSPGRGGIGMKTFTNRAKDYSGATESRKPNSKALLKARAKINTALEEMLDLERTYVSCLTDIVEGYLKRCREHPKLFAPGEIKLIFGNIELIYEFQKSFLTKLEKEFNKEQMEDVLIGQFFVENVEHFYALYTEYCEHYPHSNHAMDLLTLNDQYAYFFEELLKCTSVDHLIHGDIEDAHKVMKGVSQLIDKRKRRLEKVTTIAEWQETITNWKEDDIYKNSTELIYSGVLHKISRGRSQERHFFLFDHQIVYCRKDAIGGKLTYKGRLSLDNCDIVDLQDGIAFYGGAEVKYAWKMSNRTKNKWYVLYAKSATLKNEWMDSFQRERDRVREDSENGFHIPLTTKKAAVALINATASDWQKKKNYPMTNAPSAPIGLRADRIGTMSMLISWLEPHRLNGIIKGYEVSLTSPDGRIAVDVAGETTSTELTSLRPHTKYTISVRAKTVEFGDYSTPVIISTLDDDISAKLSSILGTYKTIMLKELKISKLIFYGTPRTGKTTLRKQLLRSVDTFQTSNTLEPSTNIAEICDPVFVERVVLSDEENSEWKWTVQGLDDIAKMLLNCLDNKRLQNPQPKREASIPRRYTHCKRGKYNSPITRSHSVSNTNNKQHLATGVLLPKILTPKVKEQTSSSSVGSLHHCQTQSCVSIHVDIKQLFLEAVKTGKWSDVVSALHIFDKAMLIQIIDGGGQPSFQEIFPLLISGTSVTLLMFKLTDDLLQPNPVLYQPNDSDRVEQKWQDTYVVRDCIFHALSGLISLQPESCKAKVNPLHSKVLLVGTHKDKLEGSEDEKKAKVKDYAQSLFSWLRHSKALFKLINVHSIDDFITDISNFNHQDVLKIRKKIEKLISHGEPQNIPAPWLVFDFVLHKYAKLHMKRKVKREEYEAIAILCGIKVDEIGVVLHYLHHVAGTLLYYSDIPELQEHVITDFQLIFDSISKVIIQYFDRSAHMGDKELFCKKAQFEASVLQEDGCCLNVNELLALLQHRHIVSQLEDGTFFMPSVLPKAQVCIEPPVNSCSMLVMFDFGYCPVGLFCAAATRLIVAHKWEINRSEQFRNKISFHCSMSGNCYTIVFTAYPVHYEVKLVEKDAPSQIKFHTYKAIKDVFEKICRDLQFPYPVYGFYCPETCTYEGATYPQFQHPAKCSDKAKQMKCFYTDTISKLTEEHKMWFHEEESKEQTKGDDDFSYASGDPLGEDDLVDVMEAVVGVATNWKFIGMALRIKPATLDIISSKHASDAKEYLSDMLRAWLQQCYDAERFGQPSWKLLCQAIHNHVGGNNPALAKKIAKKYMKSSSS